MSVLTRFLLFCAHNDEPKEVSRTFSGNVAEANGDWPNWKAPGRGVKDGDGKTASHHARFRGGEKRAAETHEEAPRLILKPTLWLRISPDADVAANADVNANFLRFLG